MQNVHVTMDGELLVSYTENDERGWIKSEFDLFDQYVNVHSFEIDETNPEKIAWMCSEFQEVPEFGKRSPVTYEIARALKTHQSFSMGDVVQVTLDNDEEFFFISGGHQFVDITDKI